MADPKNSPMQPISGLSAAASVRKTGVALAVTLPVAGAGGVMIGSGQIMGALAKILFVALSRENNSGLSGNEMSFINTEHMPEIISGAKKQIFKFSAQSLQGILQENAVAFGYERGSVPDLATIWSEESVHHRTAKFKDDFHDADVDLDAAGQRFVPQAGEEQHSQGDGGR